MSTVGLFAMGVLVTLIVGAGLSLLVYGAILDGRDEAHRKAAEAQHAPPSPERNGRPAVAQAIDSRAASRSRLNRRDT